MIDTILSEIDHRIKNTFQSLISYIGIMYADRESVSREEIEKLIRFVRSLSYLYEISLRDLNQGQNTHGVKLEQIIGAVVQLNSVAKTISVSQIPEFYGTYRQAVSLGLILNELLDNAAKYGDGPIKVDIKLTASGGASLQVMNKILKGEAEIKDIRYGTGLRLVELMAKADLNATPLITCKSGIFEVLVPFVN